MIDEILFEGYKTISLSEMGNVKLMNRIDTKYVTHIDKIIELLRLAKDKFMIQQIEGQCNMQYYTRYYDTADGDMFYQHQRGKKIRQKIRQRKYQGDTTIPFLEIKSKTNKGRTKKQRVQMVVGENLYEYTEFLSAHTNYDLTQLLPRIENRFYRITLVNNDKTERITIDTGLEFHNLVTDKYVSLPNIGIIEWKRDGQSKNSQLKELLVKLRIHESGFSKYCIGLAVTDIGLRQNRLKKRLRYITKIHETKYELTHT